MVHSFFHTPLHAQLRRKDICELAPLYQPGGRPRDRLTQVRGTRVAQLFGGHLPLWRYR